MSLFRNLLPIDRFFTVTFDADGGTPVPEKQIVQKNKVARLPAQPEKAYYDFEKWVTPDGEAYDFDKPVIADLVLKAQWTPSLIVESGTVPTEIETVKSGPLESYYVIAGSANFQHVFGRIASFSATISDRLGGIQTEYSLTGFSWRRREGDSNKVQYYINYTVSGYIE